MIEFPKAAGVLLAGLACFITGGLWFSPLLFGRAWMRELHVNESEQSRTAGVLLAIPQSWGAAFVLGTLIASAHIRDAGRGLVVGLLVWAGFSVAMHLPAAYLERAPRRFLIDIGHKFVACAAMGLILGALH